MYHLISAKKKYTKRYHSTLNSSYKAVRTNEIKNFIILKITKILGFLFGSAIFSNFFYFVLFIFEYTYTSPLCRIFFTPQHLFTGLSRSPLRTHPPSALYQDNFTAELLLYTHTYTYNELNFFLCFIMSARRRN